MLPLDKSSNLNKLCSNEDEEDEDYEVEAEEELDFEIKDGIAVIPEGITEIGDLAFKGSRSLKSIIILS